MNHYRSVTVPPYRYMSDGPWFLAAIQGHDGAGIELTMFDTLFEAVAAFDRFFLPPLRDRHVGVYDDNQQLLLYYEASHHGDNNVAWAGTGEGFGLLELIHESPGDVVLWAAAARGDFNDLAELAES